ncbi:MAG TPA: hypothetical protein GXX38_07185 [Clostridia bacterium]|jgi:hypothetical protein|nr:hypothetical protein [Clostridia bacterium]
MRTFKYVILYLLIIQLVLPLLVPLEAVYNFRMDYEIVKDRIEDIDPVLEQISKTIKEKKQEDYLIILGDSVAYSGPGGPEQSISFYLSQLAEKEGKELPVYNLALPAMQAGDLYTMLLKLQEYGISTDKLIINLIYSGFVARKPDPPCVFWLAGELKRLDPTAYETVRKNLAANNRVDTGWKAFSRQLSAFIFRKVNIFKYKDYLARKILAPIEQPKGEDPTLGRPWFEKEFLPDLLQQPEYQKAFSDQAFIMDETNPQIYFLQKIISRQQDKKTLIFLASVNRELMQDNVEKAGYKKNLELIDQFFAEKPVAYLNLHDAIPNELFSDHLHLIPEGYQYLAEILWGQAKAMGMLE